MNQTIMRSINTTVSSLLPLLALMVIAVGLLGVGTLKDLAVVQVIGIVQGTFSSIFLAAPFLVSLKRRQKEYAEHDAKVAEARAAGTAPVVADGADAAEARAVRDDDSSDAAPARRSVATPTVTKSATAPRSSEIDGGDDDGGDAPRPATWRPGR